MNKRFAVIAGLVSVLRTINLESVKPVNKAGGKPQLKNELEQSRQLVQKLARKLKAD